MREHHHLDFTLLMWFDFDFVLPLRTYLNRRCTELEKLNMECESTLSRECSLDAVAARNILKVALASKVTLEENVERIPNQI